MPLYQIKCDVCGKEEDVYRTIAEYDNLPDCCGEKMHRMVVAPAIVADYQPYQAMAIDEKTGKAPVIEGRKQHREFLKRNRLIEVGDQVPKLRDEVRGDFNIRKDLTEAVHRVLPKYS